MVPRGEQRTYSRGGGKGRTQSDPIDNLNLATAAKYAEPGGDQRIFGVR